MNCYNLGHNKMNTSVERAEGAELPIVFLGGLYFVLRLIFLTLLFKIKMSFFKKYKYMGAVFFFLMFLLGQIKKLAILSFSTPSLKNILK